MTISNIARQAAEKIVDRYVDFPPGLVGEEHAETAREIYDKAVNEIAGIIDAATAEVRENADLMARAIKAERAVTGRISADKDAVIERLREELAELKGTQDFREVTGCRDCGKPISIEANQCPHCHHFQ